MKISVSREQMFILFGFFFLLFFTRCFQIKFWNPTYAGWFSYVIYAIVLWQFLKIKRRFSDTTILVWIVWGLVLIPLLQLVSKVFIYKESLMDERGVLLGLLTFLLFFVLWHYNVSEKRIITLFTVFTCLAFFIQTTQQFFHAHAIFGTINEALLDYTPTDIAEVRNGIYRFRISGIFVVLFCMYFYWGKVLEGASKKDVILFLISLVSVYLYLTRQVIIASLSALVISLVMNKMSKKKLKVILLIVIFGGLFAYSYFDTVFGSLLETTKEQSTSDNIRVICANFYWEKVVEGIPTFFLGHGLVRIINYWQDSLRLFVCDIGFIGEWFVYGFFWVLLYFFTVYVIVIKYRCKLPLYIRLFVLGTFFNSVMIFPYRSPYEYFVWTCMLYISSKYIQNSKG